MSATARSVLVIHPGALGDVLLALPAIRAVRNADPSRSLSLVANAPIARLLHACNEVDRMLPCEGSALTDLLRARRRGLGMPALEGCDLAIAWMADSDGSLQRSLSVAGVGCVLVGSPFHQDLSGHQTERFKAILPGLWHVSAGTEQPLIPSNEMMAASVERLRAYGIADDHDLIALHPGSGSRHKCARPELFVDTIRWSRQRGLHPVMIEGPADAPEIAEVLRRCDHPPTLIRGEDLCTIAALLSRVSFFVGHDSGLTHLAAWLAKPTIALFGPTDPQRWAPRGTHVTVLTGRPCECHGWAAAQACTTKPCLQIQSGELIAACERAWACCSPPLHVLDSPAEFLNI